MPPPPWPSLARAFCPSHCLHLPVLSAPPIAFTCPPSLTCCRGAVFARCQAAPQPFCPPGGADRLPRGERLKVVTPGHRANGTSSKPTDKELVAAWPEWLTLGGIGDELTISWMPDKDNANAAYAVTPRSNLALITSDPPTLLLTVRWRSLTCAAHALRWHSWRISRSAAYALLAHLTFCRPCLSPRLWTGRVGSRCEPTRRHGRRTAQRRLSWRCATPWARRC